MIDTQKLLNDLKEFSGTENYYKQFLFPNYLYTDGVKYLAEQANCYWLIDYIFSNQHLSIIGKELFQTWKIITNDESVATIIVEDGNGNIVKKFKLAFTDFPLKEFTLWFTNNTLLLPSEY